MGKPGTLSGLIIVMLVVYGTCLNAWGRSENPKAGRFYEAQRNLLIQCADYPDARNAPNPPEAVLELALVHRDNVYQAGSESAGPRLAGHLRFFRAVGMSGSAEVALTWQNPESGAFTGVDIIRRSDRFPDPLNPEGDTVVTTLTSGEKDYVDGPFEPGAVLFYAIYPRAGSGIANEPQFARVIVGVDVDFLSESLESPAPHSGHQITFVPNADLGAAADSGSPGDYVNHTNYAATVRDRSASHRTVRGFDGSLPVGKQNSIPLPLSDNETIQFSPAKPFPYFGVLHYSLHLSANGFISPEAPRPDTGTLDAIPSLENHFGKPRISFLFSDLDPSRGGVVWMRELTDRLAITFEGVPASSDTTNPAIDIDNTVQVELFYSGQIRMTYLGLAPMQAVIGLSDGRGLPLDPVDIISKTTPAAILETDFLSLPAPVGLELLPIPVQFVEAGDTVEFVAEALSNFGAPNFTLLDAPANASINPVTGVFSWNSAGFTERVYTFSICTAAGGIEACQIANVFLQSAGSSTLPVAENVLVSPATPLDSNPLMVGYDYLHPTLAQGASTLSWFRNNVLEPALNNTDKVPSDVTQAGDTWYCVVTPAAIASDFNYAGGPILVRGTPVQSNIVMVQPELRTDVNNDGKVNSIDLQIVVGKMLGVQPKAVDADVNCDGKTDVSDVQIVVNTILVGE